MNYDFNDDEMSDRLDHLADKHAALFEWLDTIFEMPESILPENWEDFVVEPSNDELSAMNVYANLLIEDFRNNDGLFL